MIIPHAGLPTETLHRLLAEIVSRDGTDYGDEEQSTEQKIVQAMTMLQNGSALLVWDADSESASLLDAHEARGQFG